MVQQPGPFLLPVFPFFLNTIVCYTYFMKASHPLRVVVLRGGPSDEFEVSLKTGATVLEHIPKDSYHVQDIVIARDGVWHKNGVPISPHKAISQADNVFNALHGAYGEDGKLQHILELHRIPFTGSGSFASALAMNKVLAKKSFKKNGIKTPHYKVAKPTDNLSGTDIAALFRSFSLPFIVKPVSSGSSVGVTLVKDFASFEPALTSVFALDNDALIEEFIPGVEATVGVIEDYRDHDLYTLPPVEIRQSEKIVPGNFSHDTKKELEEIARKVHEALDLRHYSRTDFIVTPKRGIFVLEVNTLPGLTSESLIPKALHSVGSSLSHFIDHLLKLAVGKKR
jgi:D-alanine--D-alanine ligase